MGQVIETGNHADLVALGGEYASLWAMQQAAGYETSSAAEGEGEAAPDSAAGELASKRGGGGAATH